MEKKFLYISIISGVIGAFLLWSWTNKFAKKHAPRKTLRIMVARKNLEANTPIKKEMFKISIFPARYSHPNSVSSLDFINFLGQKPFFAIKAGQPLLWTDFRGQISGNQSLSDLIKDGERAFTLRVSDTSSAAGNIHPGDHVDIMGTFTKPANAKGDAGDSTLTLLQNVVVLATGSSIGSSQGGERRSYTTITLNVTLEEAELLTFAQKQGTLDIVLRNSKDVKEIATAEKNFSDIFDIKKRIKLQKKRKKKKTHRITEVQSK